MKEVCVVFGTRPEAIKLCPLVKELRKFSGFKTTVCVSGQHRSLLDSVLDVFEIQPEHDLDLMTPHQTPASITGKAIQELSAYFESNVPDGIVVQGDTATAFAGAFAGFLNRIPVFHVEAGLRTGRYDSPFPEEMNRVLIGRIASLHFCPTENAANSLRREGVDPSAIYVTGNTIVEAVRTILERTSTSQHSVMVDHKQPSVLVTTHRRESFGDQLRDICSALRDLAGEFQECRFLYVLHPNPAVQETVKEVLGSLDNIILLPPQDYPSFLNLLNNVSLVISDSGGVQEESTILGFNVLVLREVTERPEAVDAGFTKIIGTDPEVLVREVRRALRNGSVRPAPLPVFGDGSASRTIARHIQGYLSPNRSQ